MSTLSGNKKEHRLSLTFCKWCNNPIHRSKKDRIYFQKSFCDKFCEDEFNFNRDLKNKFLGKYNLIDQDIIAEELKERGFVNIDYAFNNSIPTKHFSQYVQHLKRLGWNIKVDTYIRERTKKRCKVYKLINV